MGQPELDARIEAAVSASNLRSVRPEVRRRLLERARVIDLAPGRILRGEGDLGPHVELVLDGFLRIYLSAPDGRTVTVRYCRQGALLGMVSLFRTEYVMLGTIQALTPASVLSLPAERIRHAATEDPTLAQALFEELSERMVMFILEIRDSAFATVRERIARHLLDLASEQQEGVPLVARVTQRELAEAAGTVREVVVRVLRDLRLQGIVRTSRDRITILEPERLAGELRPREVRQPPTDAPLWNRGR